MRRIILIFLLALSPSLMLSAQENKVVLVPRLSIATVTDNNVNAFKNYSYYSYDYPLAYVYGDYYSSTMTAGNITASLDIILSKRCAVSVDLGYTPMWRDAYDGITNQYLYTQRGGALNVLCMFKLFYMVRPVVRLYGDIGVGIAQYFSNDNSLEFAGQLVPFGIEVGKKCFGFVEFGVGSSYMGARGGVGYRF